MSCGTERMRRDESGQAIVFAVIVMVVLIAFTGFAVDVGRAYLAQRQLQAATDAAALAGALELPDNALAQQMARDYGPEPGMRNRLRASDNATVAVQTKCVTAVPTGCTPGNGVNAIKVDTTSTVPTVFAKIVGVDSLTVKAQATACSPCTVKPLDIMLVLDRTGSMCERPDGSNDPACTKLRNAREGVEAFLQEMNPLFHRVGLSVLPPASGTTRNAQCSPPTTPSSGAYDGNPPRYLIAPLANDYASSPGTLNAGSTLVDRVRCQLQGGGRTAYAGSLDSARAQLNTNGRAGVQKVIVFLSDGAANYGGNFEPSQYRTQPCRAGIDAAARAKADGTLIYAIGYDLDGSNGVYQACLTRSNALEAPGLNARQAMERIASDPLTFFNQTAPTQLRTVFRQIAADIFRTAQLIDDSLS